MANVVDRMTERLLTDAGVGPGQRVLDVGCGRGDVSFMAARLVGDRGHVLGVDRDAGPLVAARARAADLGLADVVTFAAGDLSDPWPAGHRPFDAAVGRRVLMYQPDPVDVVRRLARAVRPGGLVCFQEHDLTAVPARLTPLPEHDRALAWLRGMLDREGANPHMGFDLFGVLAAAGLVGVQVRAEAVVQTPTTDYPTAGIVRACLPRIVALGVATAAEVDVDTLDARLAGERRSTAATYVSDLVFGAWATTPA